MLHCVQGRLGEYDTIKLINYIRNEVSKGSDVLAMLRNGGAHEEKPWSDEQFLIPKLQDDQLLFYDFEGAVRNRYETIWRLLQRWRVYEYCNSTVTAGLHAILLVHLLMQFVAQVWLMSFLYVPPVSEP